MSWLESRSEKSIELETGSVEHESKPTLGVAVLVVGLDKEDPTGEPLVWTIKERHTKASTDKIAGQLSSPAETGKVGESSQDTTLAALAEFTGSDEDLDRLSVLAYMPRSILVSGNPADVVVMFYDGPLTDTHVSVDPNETIPNGWVKSNELRKMNGELRPAMHSSLAVVNDEVLRDLIASRDSLPSETIRDHVGPNFSLRAFANSRESKKDMPIV